MNALLLEIFLFYFRAACGLWLVSYGPKHASQSSDTPFVHISSITWKPQGACNSTKHHTTPLLPRILCFMSTCNPQLWPCVNIGCLVILWTSTNDNKAGGHLLLYHTHTCTYQTAAHFQGCIFYKYKVRYSWWATVLLLLWCLCPTCRLYVIKLCTHVYTVYCISSNSNCNCH